MRTQKPGRAARDRFVGTDIQDSGASKFRTILDHLRSKIVDGTYKSGEQLPTREQLTRSCKCSLATIQRALGCLEEEGFVSVHGRLGTLVSAEPPHLFRYGLAFPTAPHRGYQRGSWSRFFEAIVTASGMVEQKLAPRKFVPFYGIDNRPDNSQHDALLEAARARRLKGVLSLVPYVHITGSALLEQPDVPQVMLVDGKDKPAANVIPLFTDNNLFLVRAFEYLKKQGRRRIAVLLSGGALGASVRPDELPARVQKIAADAGIRTPSHWIQILEPNLAAGTRQCVELLMQKSNSEIRPDGLILADDYFVEPAVVGLTSAGVHAPRDLEIVAWANFPIVPQTPVPAKYLGLCADALLLTATRLIDDWHAGRRPKRITPIAPCFDHERG